MNSIALVTEDRYEQPRELTAYVNQLLAEDQLLSEAFARRGVSVTRVSWSSAQTRWDEFQAALLRTTWDYDQRLPEFLPWLAQVTEASCLINSATLVRWNLDKRYLRDLAQQQVAVVPTIFIDRGDSQPLAQLMDRSSLTQAVVKPVTSASGRDTYRVQRDQAEQLEDVFRGCVAREAMMLQPFMQRILEEGEVSLMVFAGQVTHGVRKTARTGEFRVQDDHGGTVHPHQPSEQEIRCALDALQACPERPTYARVDLVADAKGEPCLMEIELIEPELFLRLNPSAAEVFADAVLARLKPR